MCLQHRDYADIGAGGVVWDASGVLLALKAMVRLWDYILRATENIEEAIAEIFLEKTCDTTSEPNCYAKGAIPQSSAAGRVPGL